MFAFLGKDYFYFVYVHLDKLSLHKVSLNPTNAEFINARLQRKRGGGHATHQPSKESEVFKCSNPYRCVRSLSCLK